MQDIKKLNPGSEEAKKLGCTCPAMDNRHGLGMYVDNDGNKIFVYNHDCPIHGEEVK